MSLVEFFRASPIVKYVNDEGWRHADMIPEQERKPETYNVFFTDL